MKGMKGKLVKKLKSIKPIGYLKLDRVLQVNAADGFIETLTKSPSFSAETQFIPKEPVREKVEETRVLKQEPDIIDVAELMRDLEEDEMEVDDDTGDKENIGPPIGVKDKMETSFRQQTPLLEINISSFRRPDLNSGTLFDPNLLSAFEQAVKEHFRLSEAERQARIEKENLERRKREEEEAERNARNLEKCEEEPPLKSRRIEEEEEEEEEEENPLLSFEEKCPPGDSDSVILYTTTLRGIRKTFEECNSIRFLLESFRVIFCERDVSMHMEFKEELWRVLEGKVKPPRLFIRGRYIGGAEEVLRLHEQGKFRVLFEGVPIDKSTGPCEGCAGFKFVVCFNCSGSHRIVEDDGMSRKCQDCNENGLIICPLCC
ncbi:hypothetical protein P3X46_025185 [Hevea brasiliensis]|uniref:Glutaredoxin domain-containing protein n=1 Tax=Hevea brasiliensis TaxID=3981 RepID=A0ABQ9L8C2_HEVBR|nr:uncharacterized protein LOC110667303 [Hevea brasiliensis]KAJ9159706.1 hypothetical protein P3X46_025185 [Hevea brasiliensis]